MNNYFKFLEIYNNIILQANKKTMYIVKSGDVLSKIAKKFNVSLQDIISVNKLTNPNKLKIGQKLIIPSNQEQKVQTTENQYIVKKGDVLSKIALNLGVKLNSLIEANNLEQPYTLQIGQKLIIPSNKVQKKQQNAPKQDSKYILVKVKSGDTFTSIAQNNMSTVLQIKKANPDIDPSKLRIGQTIKIPKKPKAIGKIYPESQNQKAKEVAFEFIKDKQGTVKNGNFHVVYDDKVKGKNFDPNTQSLNQFLNEVVGVPTIGYGTTDIKFIKANNGQITDQQSKEKALEYITQICDYMPNRFGQSWKCLNRNQRAALISFFYQQGKDRVNSFVNNMIKALQKNNLKEVCKNIDSVDPRLAGRRKAQRQLFNKKLV